MRRPRNFSFIDQLVAGSALLSSPEEVDWLAANGITTVISLTELSPEVERRLRELGIEHFSFPVNEFEAPPIGPRTGEGSSSTVSLAAAGPVQYSLATSFPGE